MNSFQYSSISNFNYCILLDEQILKDSSKYKLYNKLNDDTNINEYKRYCSNKQFMNKNYEGFTNLCYIFAKNYIKLPQILNDELDANERCRYFNFWITDIVRKKWENEWKNKPNILYTLRVLYAVENAITVASHKYNCHFNYNRLHDKYKRECCKFPSEKCHNPMKLDYFCKNDDLFNKLKCDINNGVAAASSEHERSQTMDGTQENDISHSVSSSSLEHHTDENVDGITNNTDYYPKRGFTTYGNWIRSKLLKNEMKVNLGEDAQNFVTYGIKNAKENIFTDDCNITYHPA
ncbi:PIR protein [Plasmodium ovale]|uniref:PIR protein n=1 Tax=Plasmodium ovale TaxID=36330 RepID=A0A1D3JE27_PLAOA|nr:PIR protein [Plasmodium ovale]